MNHENNCQDNNTEFVSKDAEELRNKGNEEFKKKNFKEAELFYKQALEMEPSNAKTLSNLAACLISLNEPNEAIKYADQCIKNDPNWSKGYFRKAKSHEILKQTEMAYINAAKCAFYEPAFKSELEEVFKSNQRSLKTFCIVNKQIDIDLVFSKIFDKSMYFQNLLQTNNSVKVFIINNCEVKIEQPIICENLIFIGIGDRAKITESSLYLSNSKCILSDLKLELENERRHLIFASKNSDIFINECYLTTPGKQCLATLCLVEGSILKMQNSNVCDCNEAGILIAENSKCDLNRCSISNTGISHGAGIEIKEASEATIDSCSIDRCAKGFLIWHEPGDVLIKNCVISNNRSEGLLISFKPDFPFNILSQLKTKRSLTKLLNNNIFLNSAFGVTADEHSNVIMSKNEIHNNGNSGCIIKGNTNATLVENYIHRNKSYGIHIGMNYEARILIRNNQIEYNHSNKAIYNIYTNATKAMLKASFGSDVLVKPVIESNKIIDESEKSVKKFTFMSFSGNRPSKRLWNDFDPFLYSCGNTFAFNLLSLEQQSSQENNVYDILLGGCCDFRHLIETVYYSTLSLNQTKPNETKLFNLVLNDVNVTNLARIVVLIYAIQQNAEILQLDFKNIEKALFTADLLMLWTSPQLYPHQKEFLNKLLNQLENIFSSRDKIKKNIPWLVLPHDQNESLKLVEKMQTSFGLWKKYNYSNESLFFHGLSEENAHIGSFQKLIERYSLVSKADLKEGLKDLSYLLHGNLKYSKILSNYASKNTKHKLKLDEVNSTVFTIPTLELNVYPTTCLFRSFDLNEENSELSPFGYGKNDEELVENFYDKFFDKLVLHLGKRFEILSLILSNVFENVKMTIHLENCDLLDLLTIQNPSNRLFNVIYCSNLGEYIDCLSLLLSASLRLKDQNSKLTMHFMKYQKEVNNLNAKSIIESILDFSLEEMEKKFNLKCFKFDMEANGSYINTFWTKSVFKQESDKNLMPLIDKLIKVKLNKSGPKKNLYFSNMFSASSLVMVINYLFENQPLNNFLDFTKQILVKLKNTCFYEEFIAIFCLNMINKKVSNNEEVIRNFLVQNEADFLKRVEFKLKIKKSFLIELIGTLRINEFIVRLKIFDSKNENKNFQIWNSFEMEKVGLENLKIIFFCTEIFYENHKNWRIKIETESSVMLDGSDDITESTKLSDSIKSQRVLSSKVWFDKSLNI